MEMMVAIPSRGRWYRQRTLEQLPREWDICLFVPPEEAMAEKYGRFDDKRVDVVPRPEGRIAVVREYIGQYAQRHQYDKFVMMDDDLQFLVRKTDDDWRLRNCEPQDVQEMLSWMQEELDSYPLVALSPREGNNRFTIGPKPALYFNNRPMRVQGWRTDEFLKWENTGIDGMEDFDMALQLLRRGGTIAITAWWASGQGKTQLPGGCAVWRTNEVHDETARKLRDRHPNFVSLRQKQNKTDADGFGTRTEVTVQWKAAWQEGQRRARAVV